MDWWCLFTFWFVVTGAKSMQGEAEKKARVRRLRSNNQEAKSFLLLAHFKKTLGLST